MPLPTASNAADTEYLQRLYDEYCKIALKELLRAALKENAIPDQDGVAFTAHQFATAMLNERKK